MDKKDNIKKIMKEDRLEYLRKYKHETIATAFLDILIEDLSSFSYDSNIDVSYLAKIIDFLPNYIKRKPDKKLIEKKLNEIHLYLKTYLVQKPGHIDKSDHNYKLFKNMINDIELLQISITYDYKDLNQGKKYNIINYFIFGLKNISIFRDALIKFPYLVNYYDKDDTALVVTVANAYINRVMKYTNDKGVDDILHFYLVLKEILSAEKFVFDVIDKQTIIKKIKDSCYKITSEKERKTYYFNLLLEMINGKEKLDEESTDYKFDISRAFSPAIKSEVKKIKDNYSIDKGRKIIEDYIITVDGDDPSEIDDALSVKILDNGNIVLSVHISDPLALFDMNSIIFDEAVKRTTSIYLSDYSISMLPKEISTDLASLKEKNYRPATTYTFEFDKNGDLVNFDLFQSIIKVNRNLTYSDFNHILTMNSNDRLNKTVSDLSMTSNILQKYYKLDPVYKEIKKEKSNVSNTTIIGNTSGEKTVENSMIFTNYYLAKYCLENNILSIFRNLDLDNLELKSKIDSLGRSFLEAGDSKKFKDYLDAIKKIYPRAYCSTKCTGHDGLGGIPYRRGTSTIRRLDDLLNLLCMYKYIFGKLQDVPDNDFNSFIVKCCKHINTKRPSIEKYQEEKERLKSEKILVYKS